MMTRPTNEETLCDDVCIIIQSREGDLEEAMQPQRDFVRHAAVKALRMQKATGRVEHPGKEDVKQNLHEFD